MKITVKIDQAEAIRRGIDAPHETVQIEVDPATLTQDERDEEGGYCDVEGHDLGCVDRMTPRPRMVHDPSPPQDEP